MSLRQMRRVSAMWLFIVPSAVSFWSCDAEALAVLPNPTLEKLKSEAKRWDIVGKQHHHHHKKRHSKMAQTISNSQEPVAPEPVVQKNSIVKASQSDAQWQKDLDQVQNLAEQQDSELREESNEESSDQDRHVSSAERLEPQHVAPKAGLSKPPSKLHVPKGLSKAAMNVAAELTNIKADAMRGSRHF